jgi:hypothetical protein
MAKVRAEESPQERDHRFRQQQAAFTAKVESPQERDQQRLLWQSAYEARVRFEDSSQWLSTEVLYPAPLKVLELPDALYHASTRASFEETTLQLCKRESD